MSRFTAGPFHNRTYAAEDSVFDGVKAKRYNVPISIPEARKIAAGLGCDDVVIRRSTSTGRHGVYFEERSAREAREASTRKCSTCARVPCRHAPGARPATPARPARILLGDQCGVWVLLHELAHHLAQTSDVLALRDIKGHDVAFRRWYLWLVDRHLGDYWYRRLKIAFRNYKLTI